MKVEADSSTAGCTHSNSFWDNLLFVLTSLTDQHSEHVKQQQEASVFSFSLFAFAGLIHVCVMTDNLFLPYLFSDPSISTHQTALQKIWYKAWQSLQRLIHIRSPSLFPFIAGPAAVPHCFLLNSSHLIPSEFVTGRFALVFSNVHTCSIRINLLSSYNLTFIFFAGTVGLSGLQRPPVSGQILQCSEWEGLNCWCRISSQPCRLNCGGCFQWRGWQPTTEHTHSE